MIGKSAKKILNELLKTSVVGKIDMYAGASAPAGWLICNGQAVSRTKYSRLFDVIGTAYGAGDGSTTFNLPNLQGRVPIGVSSSHALASTGGAETHTLTTAQIPAHTHGSKSLTGTINLRYGSVTGGAGGIIGSTETTWSGSHAIVSTTTQSNPKYNHIDITATHEHTSVGSGSAHNNMQPYLTINYIIYVGGVVRKLLNTLQSLRFRRVVVVW